MERKRKRKRKCVEIIFMCLFLTANISFRFLHCTAFPFRMCFFGFGIVLFV